MKKHLKWLIPVVVLLVVGVAVAFVVPQLLNNNDQTSAPTADIKICWNVDGHLYREEGSMPRMSSDGLYRAAFAMEGQLVDLFFDNYATLEQVDKSDVVGLVIDENNLVTEFYDIYDITGGVASYRYYVQEIYEDHLVTNSELTYRAQKQTLQIDENTVVYDVGSSGPLCGLPYELVKGSEILLAVQNEAGVVTHIFAAPPFEKQPVYWNIERQYNSALKQTTREPDVLGRYTIRMAVDGQVIEVQCKTQKAASSIDSYAGRCMALEFDEEGYVTAARTPSKSTGNGSVCSWFHITELKDNGFVAQKFASGSDKGSVKEVQFTEDVKIFDVSTTGDDCGKPTQLRVFDQVHCLRDASGDVCIVFVVSRFEADGIYWNLDRQYSSSRKVTKRTPDKDGYYYFDMFHFGEYVTLRTNDKSVANTIDSRSAKCCALKVEGDIITYAAAPGSAPDGKIWAANYEISMIAEDGTLTAYYAKTDKYSTTKPLEDCKVYDMSQYATRVGEETELRVGDKVYSLKNLEGKVYVIFVIGRSPYSPLYWNLDRTYDSANEVTKRTPDADGYYNFRMLRDDRQIVTVRTDDKALASKIDSWVACGLKLDGDQIVKAYKYNTVYLYDGGSFGSWYHVTEITDTRLTAKRFLSGSQYGNVVSEVFSTHCKVFNVTDEATVPGEATELRVGDTIQGMMNMNKRITAVYVVDRSNDVPLYWNVNKGSHTKAADGYYYLTMATGGEQVELKTKDAQIVETIDGQSVIGLDVEGNEIVGTHLTKYTVSGFAGDFGKGYKVTAISGKQITATSSDGKTVTGALAADCGIYDVTGMGTVVGEAATVRVGDTIYGVKGGKEEITHLYITGKTVNSELYYNLDRQYFEDSDKTSRKPDADGYYRITMAVNGQLKTVKTKDKTMVERIDAQGSQLAGLKLNGDEIQYVYLPVSTIAGYGGGTAATRYDITAIDGTTYSVKCNIPASSNYGKEAQLQIPADCTVYNGCDQGKTTTLKVGDRITCVRNDDGDICYVVVMARPSDTARTAACQSCGKSVTWYAWDGITEMENGMHYYLAKDIYQPYTCTIAAGKTVCMDLNGKTLTGGTEILRCFTIRGNFSLMDSGNTGKVVATKTNPATAPVFAVNADSVFKLYGGTLTSVNSSNRAGVGLVQEGVMYMYGGVLENGRTTSTATNQGGGNLEVISNSTFYMYGGTIRGGHSVSYGGNISGYASAKLYLLGGTIEGGTSDMGGNDVSAKGNIIVGGNMKIGEVYLFSGKKITNSSEKPLTTGASIGVILQSAGVFTGAVDATTAGYFHSCTGEDITHEDDGTLSMGLHVVHKHCVCMGADKTHTCNNAQVWEPWPSDNAWESGKYYYLTEDLKDRTCITIQEGQTLNLCLNGYDYVGKTSTYRLFAIYGTLNICDHKNGDSFDGNVIGKYTTKGKAAAVFRVYENAQFNVYGGNFTVANEMLEAGVGVVDKGVMRLYDGKIYGGRVNSTAANQGGGNISIFSTGKLIMYGGTITGGTSAKNGANIHMNNSKSVFEMYGGVIDGGTAPNGAISSKGTVILGGTATIEDGNIYLMTGAKIQVKDNFTGSATVEMQEGTGTFGTSAIDITERLFAKAGYMIVLADGVLTMKEQ